MCSGVRYSACYIAVSLYIEQLTIKRGRVVHERIVNEAELSNCFSIHSELHFVLLFSSTMDYHGWSMVKRPIKTLDL